MKLLFISAFLAAFAALAPSRANAAPCITLPPIDPAKGFVTNFNNSCYVLPLVAGDSHVAGDLNASYTDVYYQVTPGYELIILGTFPNARFMAATVYDDHLVPVTNLIDSAILPLNANMINPMVPGATYKPNQSYGLTISFGGGPPAAVSPGCTMLPSVAGNVLDASQIHQGITWSGSPNLPPGFPAHETGANAAGIITIRKYMDIDSPVLPEYVIVRSLANGCAIPIQQAVQSNIVSVTQHVDSSWLHQGQISAHLQFSNTVQPWLDFPSDPLNGVFWRRPSEYIPFNDSYAGYLSASFSSTQIKSLLTAQTYLRIQFQIPTTPTTPCTNGNCSLSGNEQTRYVSLSLQAPVVNCTGHTTILSIADQNLVQDPNGIVTVVAGFGAPQPPNVTAANGYTWLDLSAVPNHGSISGLIIRNLAPNPSFQCSTFSVPYKTSEYNPDGGYMGSYVATVDFPTAAQIPAVPAPVSRPNSCSLVPTQAPQALSTSTGVQSCSSNDYLSAYTATVGSAAGSGSVLLTAGGAWTASSNASWLQLSPGSASGSGNAVIQFSYSANQSTAAQTGTLTIAGATFTVTQAGTSYSPITLVTPLLSSGLNNPQGLAADAAGDVFIADAANNAIKQWSPGTQQTALLSSAENGPSAVAVDGFGNVYIADSGNHAIEEFTSPGQQLTTLVSGLSNPSGVAVDGQGNVYFSDTSNNAIEEWNAALQQVTTLVGTGLNNPAGVAVDTQGNVYFADSGNNSIKEWAPSSGLVTPLVSSGLNNPTGLAVDGQGNVYFADTGNNAIKQWNAVSQQVTALVSTGLSSPMGVAVDGQGNIYVADTNHGAIEKLTPVYLALSATSLTEPATAGTDSITAQVLPTSIPLTATSDQPWLTVSGINSGVIGLSFPANITGANLTAHVSVLGQPVTVTQSGDAPASLTKLAGDAQTAAPGQAFATPLQVTVSDGGGIPLPGVAVTFTVTAGASATFSSTPPMPILTDINGNASAPALTATSVGGSFSVTASVNALSVVFTETTVIHTLGASALAVGNTAGSGSVLLSASDSWTASSNAAWLQLSAGSTSGTGNALIQFTYAANPNSAAQTGALTIDGLTFTVTQAGTSYSPVSQLTTLVSTGLNNPQAVAVDAAGNVYIADTFGNAIRKWNAGTQQVTTLVSSGLNNPTGVAVGLDGNVYIADQKNKAMKEWRVATGTMTPLVSGGLSSPVGAAVDSQGNVYFSDAGHNAIDEWNAASGKVTVLVAGAGLNLPLGTAVDSQGNVYFSDEKNNAIKEWSVAAAQVLTLVSTGLNTPYGVAVDGDGNVYFADTGNNAIKEWNAAAGQVTVLVSTGLKSPCGVAVDAQGNVYIADSGDNAIKKFTPAYLALGANSRTEAAAAGTDSVSFQVLPAGTAVSATSNQTWLTISSVNNGSISFAWAANTTASSRSAQITVLGQTVTITQNADVPTTLNKTAGLAQSTPVGQAFAIPLQVKVLDAAGKPVQGASVTFKVVAAPNGAGATFAASPAMPILTNSSGIAIAPVLTANSIPGTSGVTVSVGTLSTVFGATVTSN